MRRAVLGAEDLKRAEPCPLSQVVAASADPVAESYRSMRGLAEAAALLVLRKKADALWGDEDASTESKSDDESSS